ncbi:conserved Plasmodium protein, unknown function [Plasmodium vinckei brucechwatti]|uniref:Uncharacterized protein n=1 Tax=Plasmodium vinckei brucechwatti TaxID=119398 RepID=A0A6V7RSE0_PLAVN|nr:conserved Plasmodium protein, unknown function [Plasmodium vinckei brucechwatti]
MVNSYIIEIFLKDFISLSLFFLIYIIFFLFYKMKTIFFSSLEKQTQTEDLIVEINLNKINTPKDGYENVFKGSKEIIKSGKMSISSIETIYPYLPSEKKGEQCLSYINDKKNYNVLQQIEQNDNTNTVCKKITINNDSNAYLKNDYENNKKCDLNYINESKSKEIELKQTQEEIPEKVDEQNGIEQKNYQTQTCKGEEVIKGENLCNIQNNINGKDKNSSLVESVKEIINENNKSIPFMDDKKKVIINDNKHKDNNIYDNFSYLNNILEKKYKEYINLDGSEYVYIYDICTKSDNCESFESCERSKILNLDNKNVYLNFFNNFSNKIIKIKKMFSTDEMAALPDPHFGSNQSEECNLETVLNNKHDNINEKINECDAQTTSGSTQSENSSNADCDNVKKSKFIDKLNYIFYTIIKNNNFDKNDNDNCGEDAKMISNSVIDKLEDQKNIKKYELTRIDMDKLISNMKLYINKRVFETDIYDIEIKRKGYIHIYIDNGCWKQYYCILFYLNNNSIHKDNLILKHYCKIYEGEYLYSNYNYSDWYTNCFLVFFNDNNFEFEKKNNIDLSILIRKNMYELIFEISNNNKVDIINNINCELSEKINKCIIIYDIYSMPYYLIPFDYVSPNSVYEQSFDTPILNQECKGLVNLKLDSFIYPESILNSWIYCINMLTHKYIKNDSININNNKPIKKVNYVNKKFNQWIEVFKQERNIKRCGKIY